MGSWVMTDDQARHDFNEAIKSIRNEMRDGFKVIGERIARIESRDDSDSKAKIIEAFEEGRTQGRVEALEKRMDKADRWIITIGGALLVAFIGWIMSAIQRIPLLGGGK